MKGSNYSTLYGKYILGEPITIYVAKGLLRARRLAKTINRPLTRKIKENMSIFASLAKTANSFDIDRRSRWAAAVEYEAHLKAKERSVRWPWYFPRRTRLQTSWFTLFIAKNLIAASCKMSWPRLKPQILKDPPPAPIIIWAKYNEKGKYIEGEFHLLPASGTYSDVVVRIWLAGVYAGNRMSSTVHLVIPIENYSTKDITVVPFKIDYIRCSGIIFQQENLKFSDMAFGEIFVFSDLATAVNKEVAPMESVFSGEAVILLPRRGERENKGCHSGKRKFVLYPGEKMSKEALALLRRLTDHITKMTKKYRHANVKMVEATWEKEPKVKGKRKRKK